MWRRTTILSRTNFLWLTQNRTREPFCMSIFINFLITHNPILSTYCPILFIYKHNGIFVSFFSQTCGEWNVYLDLWREIIHWNIQTPCFVHSCTLQKLQGVTGTTHHFCQAAYANCGGFGALDPAAEGRGQQHWRPAALTIYSRCRSDTSLRRRDSPAAKWVPWNAFKVKGSVDRGHLRCFSLTYQVDLCCSSSHLHPSWLDAVRSETLLMCFDGYFNIGRWGEGSGVVRVTTGNKLTWVKACFVLPSGEFRSIFLAPSSDETLRQCGRTSYSRWGWFDMICLVLRKWPKTNLACHWVISRTQNGECWNAWLEMIEACVEVAVEERSR